MRSSTALKYTSRFHDENKSENSRRLRRRSQSNTAQNVNTLNTSRLPKSSNKRIGQTYHLTESNAGSLTRKRLYSSSNRHHGDYDHQHEYMGGYYNTKYEDFQRSYYDNHYRDSSKYSDNQINTHN